MKLKNLFLAAVLAVVLLSALPGGKAAAQQGDCDAARDYNRLIEEGRLYKSPLDGWDVFVPNSDIDAMRVMEELVKRGGEKFLAADGKHYRNLPGNPCGGSGEPSGAPAVQPAPDESGDRVKIQTPMWVWGLIALAIVLGLIIAAAGAPVVGVPMFAGGAIVALLVIFVL